MKKIILTGSLFLLALSGCSSAQPKICKKCSIGHYSEKTKSCLLNENIKGVVKKIIPGKEKNGPLDTDKNGNKVKNYLLISTESGREVVIPNFNKNKIGDIINVIFEKKPSCKI